MALRVELRINHAATRAFVADNLEADGITVTDENPDVTIEDEQGRFKITAVRYITKPFSYPDLLRLLLNDITKVTVL